MALSQELQDKIESLWAALKTFIYAHPVVLSLYKACRLVQWAVIHYPAYLANEWFFVFATGLKRDRVESMEGLTIRGPHALDATEYEAVHPKYCSRTLSSLDIHDYAQYVFVDFGSGKGRAVLMASQYPFKRVIGVEFARELHEAALRNIKLWRPPIRSGSVELVWADALEFEIPLEPCVLFFFNPFGVAVLCGVLEKAWESLKTSPRDVIILYVSPVHEPEILALFDPQILIRARGYNYTAYRLRPPCRGWEAAKTASASPYARAVRD